MEFKNTKEFNSYIDKIKKTNLKFKKNINDEGNNHTTNKDKMKYKPDYHLISFSGLINDPNGLHFDGEYYYIYYQISPFYPAHFMKHWALYKTKDFIEFEDKKILINPDQKFDQDGVFSGSAFSKENKVYIYYTGNIKAPINSKNASLDRSSHTILFDKISNNKLNLFEVDKKYYTGHFRDPFIFEIDNKKYMLNGAQKHNFKGTISIYESNYFDKNWKRKGDLKIDLLNDPGRMIECPNLILNSKNDLLIFSLQDSEQFLDFLPIDIVVYVIGRLDIDNNKFISNKILPLDYGFDFYAPQVFKDKNNRNIMYAWIGNGFNLEYLDANDGFNGMLSLPREIIINKDYILQKPLDEIKNLRKENIEFKKNLNIYKNFELIIDNLKNNYLFKLTNSKNEFIEFSIKDNKFYFSRENSSKKESNWILKDNSEKNNFLKFEINEIKNLRLFVDNSVIEIFLNDGKYTFTSRFYLDDNWKLISNQNAKIYKLDGIKIKK